MKKITEFLKKVISLLQTNIVSIISCILAVAVLILVLIWIFNPDSTKSLESDVENDPSGLDFKHEFYERSCRKHKLGIDLGLIPNFTALMNQRRIWFAEFINYEALQFGVDPLLAKIVAHLETRFYDCFTSPAGALGLMQVMPANAKVCGTTIEKLRSDVKENIKCGIFLLSDATKYWDVAMSGQIKKARISLMLAEYNAGRAASRDNITKVRETARYVVMGIWHYNISQKSIAKCKDSICIRAFELKHKKLSRETIKTLLRIQENTAGFWFYDNVNSRSYSVTFEQSLYGNK
jgi:hypothetical protein